MSRHISIPFALVGIVLLAVGVLLWITPAHSVSAQCGDRPTPSSCYACHATADPMFDQGEWHVIHTRLECCRNCHGGNDQMQDKNLAHAGLVLNPLDDIYVSCHACHPDDYRQRADQFAKILKVTPGSSEPITHTAVAAPSSGQPIVQLPPATLQSISGAPDWSAWLLPFVLGLAAGLMGLGLMWRKASHN